MNILGLFSKVGILQGGKRTNIILVILAVLVFATLPFYINVNTSYIGYYLFIVFLFIIAGQGWNLIAGYTGQLSLAGHAFFGLGAYATFIIWLNHLTHTYYYFDPVVMFLAGIVPAVVAVIVGIPLLARLRGDYFAFGTLGVGEIMTGLILQGGSITNGAGGLRVPASVYTSMLPYYWVSFAGAAGSTLAVFLIMRSSFGLALKSIREDEVSAASHGVRTLRYKVIAFAISAFMTGIAGSLYSYYLFSITPTSVMSLDWLIYPILVCILGGFGTIFGPVVGAFFVGALFSVGSVFLPVMHPVLTGVLIILVMLYTPSGLAGLKGRLSASR